MAFNVQEFSSAFKLDGARPALFQVTVTNPVVGSDILAPFMIRAATLPPSDLNIIEVPYMGRRLKYAGQRTFPEWTVTILNDESMEVRNAMETWVNRINSLQGNLRTFPTSAPGEYKSIASVTQYGKVGDILRVYNMIGLWPSSVSEIALDYAADEMETFNVTFQYDWWEVDPAFTQTGDAGGI